jgi:hypothetical protein
MTIIRQQLEVVIMRKRISTRHSHRAVILPTKIELILCHLATGQSLNRFEAERLFNDHCLSSTMSMIKNSHDIAYETIIETAPGWNNAPTLVSRYWLTEESQIKAWKLIHRMHAHGEVAKREAATC